MRLRKWNLVVGLGLVMVVGMVFYATVDGIAAKNPFLSADREGAEYVGMETCATCHRDQAKSFKLASHYKTSPKGEEGQVCESCHGPGSLHAEGMGNKTKIVNPKKNPEACFQCHMDKKAQFQLQFHHPVPEGRISCVDCHDPHGDVRASTGTALQRPNETCFKCHKEQKGPFIFEHDAMREGCQTCHNPHGAVYDKLLVADQTTTCIRCHWEPAFNQASGGIGGVPHGEGGAGYTGAGNFDIGRGEECIDHHRAPHGSNVWRTLNR